MHAAIDGNARTTTGADDDSKYHFTARTGAISASDTARQLASLAMRTGRSSMASRSLSSGWPFSQVELAFFTLPVNGEMVPGMPRPTEPFLPVAASASNTRPVMALRVCW
jgi:hypothetical protein